MIRLTHWDGTSIYVAAEHIRVIQRDDERPTRTRVYFGGGTYRTVLNSPEEVARKVLDYRLLMEQYKACQNLGRLEDAKYVRWGLLRLVGEEEVEDEEKEKSTAGTVE